jgi:lipoprotein NlpI
MSKALSKLNKVLFISGVLILLTMLKTYSQNITYDSISKQKVALIDVRKTYERVIEKGYASAEMYEYLGIYYYKDKDFQKSKLYFDMLFKKYKLSQISQKSIELYETL